MNAYRTDYASILQSVAALLEEERDPIANAANVAAVLYHEMPALNWAGFYYLRDGELVLGPFQGRPACVRIGMGKGVCGSAAAQRSTIVVPDVEAFPGHIACDSRSRSEVVIPILRDDRLIGVLDLDSPELRRFDERDAAELEKVALLYAERSALG